MTVQTSLALNHVLYAALASMPSSAVVKDPGPPSNTRMKLITTQYLYSLANSCASLAPTRFINAVICPVLHSAALLVRM